MATRAQKTKVGVFLLACLAIMGGAMSLIAGLSDPGTSYTVVFNESISGLYEGGIVTYLGVPVGKVKVITVNKDNKPVATLAIDPEKVTLYNGVVAQLVLYSFAAGSMAVSLEGGEPASGLLEPGSVIPTKASLITDISNQASEVLEDVSTMTDALSAGLDGLEKGQLTEMVKKVDGLLDDAKKIAENANKFIEEANTTITDVRGRANTLIDNVTDITEDAKPLVKNADEFVQTATAKLKELDVKAAGVELNKTLAELSELTQKFNAAMDQFDDLSANAQHEADNLEHSLRGALDEMRGALTSMQMFVDQLAQDPAQLIRGKASPKSIGAPKGEND